MDAVTSDSANQALQAEYDLSATLFASARMFESPLGKGHVLFNPDRAGLPIVVKEWVAQAAKAFSRGARVGEVLGALPEHVDVGEALDVIEYLEYQGFLRPAPTPPRYAASEFSSVSSRGMGIWVHVNNHCNLDCDYCFVNKFKSTMKPDTVAPDR